MFGSGSVYDAVSQTLTADTAGQFSLPNGSDTTGQFSLPNGADIRWRFGDTGEEASRGLAPDTDIDGRLTWDLSALLPDDAQRVAVFIGQVTPNCGVRDFCVKGGSRGRPAFDQVLTDPDAGAAADAAAVEQFWRGECEG